MRVLPLPPWFDGHAILPLHNISCLYRLFLLHSSEVCISTSFHCSAKSQMSTCTLSLCTTVVKATMSPNISPTEKQDRSPKSLLDTDIKVDEVLMESLSVSSTSSSLATSKSSDMSSEGNSFQSVRDRAQRMAATPARPPSSYGHSQPFSIPMPAPKFSDTTSSWRPEPLGGTPLNMFGVIGEPPRSTPLPIGTPAHISRGYETPMRSTPTQDYRDYQRYNATSTSAHESFSSQSHNEPQLANFHRGPITISQMLLDTRYTYGIQRSDGTFTRLIPADQLPKIQGLPQSQQSSEGMIVIPAPRAVSPLSRARGDGQPVSSNPLLSLENSEPLRVTFLSPFHDGCLQLLNILQTQWQQMSPAIGSGRPGPAYDPIQVCPL